MESMAKVTFVATGDSFITRHISEDGYDGFEKLRKLIRDHDVRFANLEIGVRDPRPQRPAEPGR